nr:nucleotide-binding protein [candidate division Zixibacteria bacterium]
MNKKAATKRILNVISSSESIVQLNQSHFFKENRDILTENLNRISAAFSGSWLGYHANVYYENLDKPKPGYSFNPEWGLVNPYGQKTLWREMDRDIVRTAVVKGLDPDYEQRLESISKEANAEYEESVDSLVTLVSALSENSQTEMLKEIKEEIKMIQGPLSQKQIITNLSPKRDFMTRDTAAFTQGIRIPPHSEVEAKFLSLESPFVGLGGIIRVARKLHKYMEMQDLLELANISQGKRIFIGHGQSPLWRELQNFIQNRLHLDWDEFNREPAAGLATTERLSSMLNAAGFALLVLTAEDVFHDKTIRARQNVVHELGLFQGKLNFRKAIIILEDGCEEFSNITGLVQIRFPKGKIEAAFDDIRRVLERERVIN